MDSKITVAMLACLILLFGCTGGGGGTGQSCSDGTLKDSCAIPGPHFCNSEGIFIDEADICGCPASEIPSGSVCVPA